MNPDYPRIDIPTLGEIQAHKDGAITMAWLCGLVFVVILLAMFDVVNLLGFLFVCSPVGVFVGIYEYIEWSRK